MSQNDMSEVADLAKLEKAEPAKSSDDKTAIPEKGKEEKEMKKVKRKQGKKGVDYLKEAPTPSTTASSSTGVLPDGHDIKLENKIVDEIKTEMKEAKLEYDQNIAPHSALALNPAKNTASYYFDLSHFAIDKSRIKLRQKEEIVMSPSKTNAIKIHKDIYDYKAFKDKWDFWTSRWLTVADLMSNRFTARFKMAFSTIDEYTCTYHSVDEQFMPITPEEIFSAFKDSLTFGQAFLAQRKAFVQGADKLEKMRPIQMTAGALLRVNRATCYFDQRLYAPQNPLPAIRAMLGTAQDLEAIISAVNVTGNRYTLVLKSDVIKESSQIALMPTRTTPITAELNAISGKVFDFKTYMFLRVKQLVVDIADISATESLTNITAISTSLNIMLNAVSSVSSTSSTVYSADAQEIFSTMVAASCMPNTFKFVVEPNTLGAFVPKVCLDLVCYLIYTPANLIDHQTVDSIKDYMFNKFMGCFYTGGGNRTPLVQNRNAQAVWEHEYIRYDGANAINTPFQRLEDGLNPNQALNTSQNGWLKWVNPGHRVDGSEPFSAFFSYDFTTTLNANGMYGNSYAKFNVVINFLSAVTSFKQFANTITNQTLNNLAGFAKVLINQAATYGYFFRYFETIAMYITNLGIFQFNNNVGRVALDLSPAKLISFTAKLNTFSADYKSDYHKSLLWSNAVRFELKFICSWFATLWSVDNGTTDYLAASFVSNGDFRNFLTKIADTYKYMATTDVGKWVWDNLWAKMTTNYMVNLIPFVGAHFFELHDQVTRMELNCGYSPRVSYLRRSNQNNANGKWYELFDDNAEGPELLRSELSINPTVINPCIVVSNDLNFPCFRTIQTLANESTTGDDYELVKKIKTGTGVVDIPCYYCWHDDSPLDTHRVLYRQPSLLPRVFVAEDLNINSYAASNDPGRQFTYYNNSLSDIVFKSSDDIDKLFSAILM